MSDGTRTGEATAAIHESGWQWRPVDGDTAFAPPFGTVRACLGCGCLMAGGPTRCRRCAADVAPGEAPSVLARVADERAEHDQKHGGPERDDERFTKDWIGIIRKQLDAAERAHYAERYCGELVKVAALAVASVESIERIRARGWVGHICMPNCGCFVVESL